VDENALVRDRRHHIVLNEVINETAGSRLVDVRRRDSGCISVLCDEFGFESLVIVCCVVTYVWTSHGIHAPARSQARLAPFGVDKLDDCRWNTAKLRNHPNRLI
jgi:hypothetical protein